MGEAVLRQVAEREAVRPLHDPGVGLVQTGQHLQECGLAGPIRAAQPDSVALTDLPGDALQQHAFAERFRKGLKLNHGRRMAQMIGG